MCNSCQLCMSLAFNYTEVLALLVQEGSYKDSVGKRHVLRTGKRSRQGYQVCARPLEEEKEEDGEICV